MQTPMETLRDDSWCVFIRKAGVCLSCYLLYKQPSEGELPPPSPLALLEKEVCSLFSSAQLALASQSLHLRRKRMTVTLMGIRQKGTRQMGHP